MSLRERVEQAQAAEAAARPGEGRLLQARAALQEALYSELPSSKIAALMDRDLVMATREVSGALEIVLRRREFDGLTAAEKKACAGDVLDLVVGLGPIQALVDDPEVTEIMVNGPDDIFFERDGRIWPSGTRFTGEQQVRLVIDRILGPVGRRVDEQSPMVSARLAGGHRVNVVVPPLALNGSCMTIRKFRERIFTLDELVVLGTVDRKLASFLREAVVARRNIAVSGGTGSGKTTLLNSLSREIPSHERIITIEDAAELRFDEHPHVVRLEARPKNTEGLGEVTIRDLVVNALRMRPDRIVVGEVRNAEAIDMLQAMNTGHDGSLTTLHANSTAEAINRLVMMVRFGVELPVDVIERQIASALDLIVHIARLADGSRKVIEVSACSGYRDGVVLDGIAHWDSEAGEYRWDCEQPRGRHAVDGLAGEGVAA